MLMTCTSPLVLLLNARVAAVMVIGALAAVIVGLLAFATPMPVEAFRFTVLAVMFPLDGLVPLRMARLREKS